MSRTLTEDDFFQHWRMANGSPWNWIATFVDADGRRLQLCVWQDDDDGRDAPKGWWGWWIWFDYSLLEDGGARPTKEEAQKAAIQWAIHNWGIGPHE